MTLLGTLSTRPGGGKERAEIDRGKRYERGSFSEGSGNKNKVRIVTRVGGWFPREQIS
jgi:hypothetical protein